MTVCCRLRSTSTKMKWGRSNRLPSAAVRSQAGWAFNPSAVPSTAGAVRSAGLRLACTIGTQEWPRSSMVRVCASGGRERSEAPLMGDRRPYHDPIGGAAGLPLVIVAAESNQSSGSKSVDHSSNAHDCEDGRNQLRPEVKDAGENSNGQKADASEERYRADPTCLPRRMPLRHAPYG